MITTIRTGALFVLALTVPGCDNGGRLEPRSADQSPAQRPPVELGVSVSGQDSDEEPGFILNLGDLSKAEPQIKSQHLSEYAGTEQQRIKAHFARPDVKEAAARVAEHAQRGPLTLVLVAAPLTNGVLTEVYLNAPPPLTRYFVAAEPGFDDEVIDRAFALAFQYEMTYPGDRQPVKFTLFRNGNYVRESATNGRDEARQFFDASYADRELKSAGLKRSAQRSQAAQVPGVGLAKVLPVGRGP